ncbi:hypothetical protein BD410DRAFT_839257 [Rickenella mellea]|uniref:Uncharacterized protein n=1 Tax=Rickenella mellea TaxID=50990 RepID=A0A4Y7Q5J9_9AGAM|nr:hypothetical protein BD410DRAFT_839257 [Rickenella mellea]
MKQRILRNSQVEVGNGQCRIGRGIKLSEPPPPGTKFYQLMELQIRTAALCYHYLRAGMTGMFSVQTREDSLKHLARISFPDYRDYPLPARVVHNAKEKEEEEGTQHLESIRILLDSWEIKEMGPLGIVQEVDIFLTMVLYFHGPLNATGRDMWNVMFAMFHFSSYDKGVIPCMFFATSRGCLNPACAFMRNSATVTRTRRDILYDRRETLNKPSGKQLAREQMELWIEYGKHHPEKVPAKDEEEYIRGLPPLSR